MSVQFGKWNFDGRPIDPQELEEVRPVLAPYGPDGEGFICQGYLAILYRAFHTTKESRTEEQPCELKSGTIVTWDGRLDNRDELISQLDCVLSRESTDLDIVCAAYERWDTRSFPKLIGDWAISMWDPRERSLILAKDFVGTRHLYYRRDKGQVTWCTILDPLVLHARRSFELEEEYVAGWLATFPATHLTPYVGIRAVPPASFVCVSPATESAHKYWDFDPQKRVCHRTDAEYEEQFRAVFSQSVRRRLRSNHPILAELSGGMDSSSIVCVADQVIGRGLAGTSGLDTVSYYDHSEANWDELPYIELVEERRGRSGCHIETGSQEFFTLESNPRSFPVSPTHCAESSKSDRRFADCVTANQTRVLLSGIGGDEVTGGIPSPMPEIADLLTRAKFGRLVHQLQAWALAKRKPWLQLLWQTFRSFCVDGLSPNRQLPNWVEPSFAKRYRTAMHGYPLRCHLFGSLPSFQEKLSTLESLRRQLSISPPARQPLYDVRYPYLDRVFMEFMFAVPPEQLVRPGERRSLMRRSLAGTVPDSILHRRRKAYVALSPRLAIDSARKALAESGTEMTLSSMGIINEPKFFLALDRVSKGEDISVVSLLRALHIEMWLRSSQVQCASNTELSDIPIAWHESIAQRI